MLPTKRLHEVGVGLLGISIAIALGCTSIDNATSVHGSAAGFGDGKANNVSVSPPSASVMRGSVTPLKCQALDSRGVVVSSAPSWTIADPGVATIDAGGSVTGVRGGSTMASCVVDGKAASSLVTVIETPVTFLEVTPGADAIVVGDNRQLIGTPRDSTGAAVDGFPVQWSTPDTSIASVSSAGVVVARGEGTANISATSGGQVSFAKISVSKSPPVPVATIYINLNGSTALNVGQTVHANAVVTDAAGRVLTGRSITWSSGNTSIFSVVGTSADKANITGRGVGAAMLTATSEGKSFSVLLTVGKAPVEQVTVTLGLNKILPGQTTQATATVTDALGNPLTGRTVTWSSLDTSIASVGSNGVVSANTTGAVVIRATSEGQTGDATETVGVDPVATVTVTLGSASLNPGQTMTATATVRDATGNVLNGRTVSWSSLNPSVATVSIGGTVTALVAGSATIRATVESQTGDATFTVDAPAPTQTPPPPAPTASVTVTLDSTNLAPGHTSVAHAVAKDSKGNVLTGKTVTWASLSPTIATVSTTGIVTATTGGSAPIQGTIDGINGAATITVIVPPPYVPTLPQTNTDSLAEPVFDATQQTMLFDENFDSYTNAMLHPACGSTEVPHRVIDHSWYYCTTFSTNGGPGVDNGVQVVPGHSGNGLSFHYDGISQESHGVVTTNGSAPVVGQKTVFVQYWAKWTPDAGYSLTTKDAGGNWSAIVQIKNIMLWHGNNRLQFDTHSHSGSCPIYGPSYTMIAANDMTQTGCESDSPAGPYFGQYADGQWHRWTIQFKPNTASGARDGIARLWIDGQLTNDLERGACGITPPGGWKPWCDVTELDGLNSTSTGVGVIEWGGPRTDASGIKLSIAIDDFKWWTSK
ncbi:MAG TPA: Ig-like domain-containing protein [Gemmatimonadaceae bacterium]|jgi:hypothetical protein|nr:Ig-like domain-containing protein [Gemmatimonadaceae bacterium]